jgi:hypothetical protein
MLTFSVLVVCSVLSGVIASRKNRSVAVWACLGFLFGVIGVLIVACLGEVDRSGSHQ